MSRQTIALRDLVRRWVVVALVAAGVTLGLLALVTPHATRAQTPPAGGLRGLPDFADLAERVGPSVVNIRTVRRLFEADVRSRPPAAGAGGSGFVLTSDGYLLTNAHVVADAAEVNVTLADGRQFEATLVGLDTRSDVAVIKIAATGLPAVKIGRSSRLRAGQWVIAIGSAFGLDNSVTAGIVSAKERQMKFLLPFIQTDVAINTGNSGGPLIDLDGEVVGVNSDLLSEEAAYAGVSLSLPIEEAMQVAEQLRVGQRVSRGQLGVSLNGLVPELAKALGLAAGSVEVRAVMPAGPAAAAGIEAGDIITGFDGKPTGSVFELRRRIVASKPGARLSVQVFRRGQSRVAEVVVSELLEDQVATPPRGEAPASKRGAAPSALALGLAAVDLTPDQKRRLGVRGGASIAAATGVAAQAGLLPEDVVVQVGDAEVIDSRQFDTLLAKGERGKPVVLLVRRQGWVQYVLLSPSR